MQMFQFKKTLQVFAFSAFLMISSVSYAAQPPVDFTADSLEHDDAAQIVTAHGNVEIIQNNQILHADQVTYDLNQDVVTAIGNVSFLDQEGQVHFADHLQLSNQMKDGFVDALISYLSEGSRFMADEGERINGTKHIMRNASFTPCKTCIEHPEIEPTWQIKASEVVHDEVAGTVTYDDARLELMGVPVFYTPYFSHPDPSIEQKNGFLRPAAGWNSNLGGYVEGSYYWGIDMTKDATLTVQPTTKQGVLVSPEYRQRFSNGFINFEPSVAFGSDRTEIDGRVEEGLTRYHLEGNGRFDINEKWRAGFNAMKTSDKEYLRLYDISNENVLQNNLYFERFDNRDYTNINVQHYQDVRLNIDEDQPDVLPSITHSMIGAPESFLGGRLEGQLGVLGLKRADDGQDVNRLSAELGWRSDHITDFGLSMENYLTSRVDYYFVRDLEGAATANDQISEARVFPQYHSEVSYPLIKQGDQRHFMIEPRVAFTASAQTNEDDIPNEDSQDIQLDALNLFSANRYPGEDLQDSGTRVTYGLGGGIYEFDGSQAKFFLGQSYRFDDDTTYPDGSGLEDDYSDIVGSVHVNFLDPSVFFDYKFQLDNANLEPQRHELQGNASFDDLSLSTRYTYAAGIPNSLYPDTREQLLFGSKYNFNPNWRFDTNVLYDLGEQPGLRKANAGFIYTNDCFDFTLSGSRSVTNRFTGESDITLVARVGFKYLGEFSAPEILLAAEEAE